MVHEHFNFSNVETTSIPCFFVAIDDWDQLPKHLRMGICCAWNFLGKLEK